MKYDFAAIEKKWQKRWEETKPYAAVTGDKRPKFYGLIEFPYPSGQGLHVGHARPYTAMDVVARKRRMDGVNGRNCCYSPRAAGRPVNLRATIWRVRWATASRP